MKGIILFTGICMSMLMLFISIAEIKKARTTSPNISSDQTTLPRIRKLNDVVVSTDFPDPQHVLDLSDLSALILNITSSNPPEVVIPSSKYKVHLWFEAKFSTEVLVVTHHDSSHQSSVDASQQQQSDKLIVMFRGSEEWDDWLSNMNIMMDKAKFEGSPQNVKVHRGYQNVLFQEDIPTKIENVIFTLFNETTLNLASKEVILSGHSQGGCLAHMMGIYLADKYDELKLQVVTFGEPRFGNNALKEWVKNSLSNLIAWRFVYRKDFAPRVIPILLGYRHTGHLYHFNDYTSSVYYDQTGGNRKYIGAPNSWYNDMSFTYWEHNAYLSVLKENILNDAFWSSDFERCKWWSFQCWFH